jgi:hypothetical protein
MDSKFDIFEHTVINKRIQMTGSAQRFARNDRQHQACFLKFGQGLRFASQLPKLSVSSKRILRKTSNRLDPLNLDGIPVPRMAISSCSG